MSLPTLNWRKLPTRSLLFSADQCSSVILNNVYDMLTGSLYFDGSARVTGSNSAWQGIGRFITGSGTGSNTEAVYCYPPTQTALSQSVIFAARNQYGARSTGYFQAAIDRQTARATGSGGTPQGGGIGSIHMACVKNAGSYTSWFTASNSPFGSGSISTGFAPLAAAVMISSSTANINYQDNLQITIYESQEAIALSLYKPSNPMHFFGIAGAIVDPEQTITSVDAESDNRLYGVATAPFSGSSGDANSVGRVSGISQYFYSVDPVSGANLFVHSTSDSYHTTFTLLTPQSTSSFAVSLLTASESPTSDYYTLSGKFVKTPIMIKTIDSSKRYVGRLRDLNMIRQHISTVVLTNQTGSIYGFTIGRSTNDIGDCVLMNY